VLVCTPAIAFLALAGHASRMNAHEDTNMTVSVQERVLMPDGAFFPFWDDQTTYRATYHVATLNPRASDANAGSQDQPWKTIGRAAEALEPGEKVVVHAGVYRECVAPRRGGNGPDSMIAYEAAAGEQVVVSGAVEWSPRCRPSSGWGTPKAGIWMADLPAESFVGYNPFLARNIYEEYVSYSRQGEISRYLLRRGAVFVDGRPLRQVFRFAELHDRDGAFWVEEPGLRIHFRLAGDADPATVSFEVTAREQAFAPREYGLGYIRVSGFSFERTADGVPVPQRAMVSTHRGHHWIIAKNRIRWANACGLDVGSQDWKADRPGAQFGRHIIGGNVISDCGVCGIAGCKNVDETLVEDNVVERIGGLDIEGVCESAGLKFHVANRVLIRRNHFQALHRASGIWMDYLNANCRVTGNLFRLISTSLGALYVESSREANTLDHNVFLDIRVGDAWLEHYVNGAAVSANSDRVLVAHNFFANIEGFAVSLNHREPDRLVGGRKIDCRENQALNNIFHACPKRIFLGRNDGNVCDGNLFDAGSVEAAFGVQDPPHPEVTVTLPAWQQSVGQDRRSIETPMEASFDPATGVLRFTCRDLPDACPVSPSLGAQQAAAGPGPFDREAWQRLREGKPALLHPV
jgi:hypothetical protein